MNIISKVYNSHKSGFGFLILISIIAIASCTDRIYSVNSVSSARISYKESINRSRYGAQVPLSPYTAKHKAYLHRKYFGRR